MNKTLIEQINEIDDQIRALQNKRSILSDQLQANASFKERLEAWVNDTRRCNVRYFMKYYKLPNLVEYCEKHEVGRNETVFISERFEEEIYTILDENEWQTTDKKSDFYVSPLVIKCLEEAISENMESFTFDF